MMGNIEEAKEKLKEIRKNCKEIRGYIEVIKLSELNDDNIFHCIDEICVIKKEIITHIDFLEKKVTNDEKILEKVYNMESCYEVNDILGVEANAHVLLNELENI